MSKDILSANALSVGYNKGKKGQKIVHSALDFNLKQGELVCILGPNGAGKSTLLRTLAGAQEQISGDIFLDGISFSEYSEKERSKMIGVVLTDRTQVGGLSLFELVALGRQPHTGFFGRLHQKDRQIIMQAIESVGIAHKAQSYVAELSDGERQKAMIAKALVQECPVILLDEPTAFLDVVSRIEIMTLLHQIAEEQGKTILLSTHDVEQALILSDRLWLLSKENGLISGVTEDIIFSGVMDHLFNREDIKFDKDHGIYYPLVHWTKKIVVKAEHPILYHWTVNALNRKGYACISAKEATENISQIEVKSPSEIYLVRKENTQKIVSFEELLNKLV